MLISTALLLDSIIRNSVCTPAKLPCRRVELGYENNNNNKTYNTEYSLRESVSAQGREGREFEVNFEEVPLWFEQVSLSTLTQSWWCWKEETKMRRRTLPIFWNLILSHSDHLLG
jgi:hypothetical protein